MAKRHHYRRRPTASSELDMTTFMNLMVVLLPFLLMTAVFSRINVVELTLPSAAGGGAPSEPEFRLEVIVRETGIELSNGTGRHCGAFRRSMAPTTSRRFHRW